MSKTKTQHLEESEEAPATVSSTQKRRIYMDRGIWYCRSFYGIARGASPIEAFQNHDSGLDEQLKRYLELTGEQDASRKTD